MISSVKSKLVTIAAMTSLSPSSTSLSSSGSASPTPSSSSSGLSSIGVGSLPTADIRITYDSDEGSALNRPEMIGIRSDRLIDREPISSSPLSSMSSPSDCLSSNTSLNSPISNFGGSCSPKPATNLTIQGLILDQTRLSISRASSMDEGIFPSPLNSPARSTPSSPIGPKFKIIHEGDIHLCRLNHQRTVISKILSSKFLRRWETHRLYLTSVNIASKTPVGFMEIPIPYNNIEDVYSVSRWDSNQKFFIRIVISDGSVLLQLPNKWVRDQWLNSINWKRCMLKFQRILVNSSIRSEILLKELKNLIELTLTTPLQDQCIYQTSLDIINELLHQRLKDFERKDYSVEQQMNCKRVNEEIIKILSPLLERTNPTTEICQFMSKHCRVYPRSMVICEHYSEIVQRILKHNMDFGKYPRMRVLVQDYFMALNQHNDGNNLVKTFIKCVHGFGSTCPHPRVISNIVSVCLASMFSLFEYRKVDSITTDHDCDSKEPLSDDEWKLHLHCFCNIFQIISQFDDWRPLLAQILQPIPFPDSTLSDLQFTIPFKSVITNICNDSRCDVHQTLLGIREGKENWLELYSPGNLACDDEGELWSNMLKKMINCCCRRKRFYQTLIKSSIGAAMLRTLRGDETCQQILCDMIEMELIDNLDMQQQIITTLQSTETGREHYENLCERQLHLKELQQKDGPTKLTLPSRSTDADLAKLLSSGSFGNLECLSLAFTRITSASAAYLIKLPSLRYLNLWSTQFSDSGLQQISEHLQMLQVLNLCETPVTDKGLCYLTSMKSLRKLNLNSTSLSTQTYEKLKQMLPALQEIDVRYTDAW